MPAAIRRPEIVSSVIRGLSFIANPRQGRRRRHEHPLAEAEPVDPGRRDAALAVVGGPPDGAGALAAGLGDDLADQIHGGGEQDESECGEQCHVINP